jgi:hypothetical protein
MVNGGDLTRNTVVCITGMHRVQMKKAVILTEFITKTDIKNGEMSGACSTHGKRRN